MEPSTFYPEINAFAETMIEVSDLHRLYVRQGGNPAGFPVLVVHGGPGSGCLADDFRFFDPDFYRIILVDQRGAGQSKPPAELRDNSLPTLIGDFELIRKRFNIKQWLLYGGSWGSTLSLAYSQAYPQMCAGLILRGIFLARQQDIDEFFKHISYSHPENAAAFYNYIPTNERKNILKAYYHRLMNPNVNVQIAAAQRVAEYTLGSATLETNPRLKTLLEDTEMVLSVAKSLCHYMMNKMFLCNNQLLNDMNKINHLYAELVHGRYDAICPYAGAFELKQHWPKALLTTVNCAGHSAYDPYLLAALINATNRFRNWYKAQV